uniref:Rho guanine nucleotide exchange factor (GEF) 7a n=1 Tax=Cyprinus carpio TaxID=7962 RepID=A0A8C1TLN6_CYPCA
MNPAEQTVTWLITLGVLESPKKTISDPDGFLQSSLKDGVVLCRLLERLRPGTTDKVSALMMLYNGHNFSRVLTTLVALNKVTAACKRKYSLSLLKDMTENSNTQLVVKARFNFQQTNEDELSFSKGDIINVTRTEEGGWWEGSLNGKTGWFPSNYVREVKGSGNPPKGFDTTAISKTYYNLVLQNILETETEYSKELQSLLTNYLRPLQMTEKLSTSDVSVILGNLEEISTFQQTLVQSLEDCTKLPEMQQKVGGFFLNLMPQIRSLYVSYCSNHPSTVSILTDHSEELGEFMEGRGASIPGILTLTSGLSKPFMRLDKYPTLLKELERHMEEGHPDRTEIQKCMTAFKNLSAHCQEVRKRKELELQILAETIRLWEGEDIKTLGSVLYMSQAMVQNHGCEDKHERYLLLFPHVLLILSASPRMSGFIYQGKLPLSGMTVTPLEDCESHKNAFELSGSMFERLQVICYNKQDLQDWLEHLNRQTKHNTMAAPSMKPLTVPCHTVSHLFHTLRPKYTSVFTQTIFVLCTCRSHMRIDFAQWSCTDLFCESNLTNLPEITLRGFSFETGQWKDASPALIVPGEEKFSVDELKSNGQTLLEEKSLVDVVYALRDEVQELKQDYKKMKKSLEEEQRARKDLERIVKKMLKNINDTSWDETNL